jgi:hypothetical protein
MALAWYLLASAGIGTIAMLFILESAPVRLVRLGALAQAS